MTATTNVLQQVQVYNRSALGYLENLTPIFASTNKKFKNFENEIANLGSSTTYDKPTRFGTGLGLVVQFQNATQRVSTLTCDQAFNVAYGFTAQERIFNVEKDVDSYMEQFGRGSIYQLGTTIEKNLGLNCVSSVPVYSIVNGQQVPTGALHTESGPYRFYGNGVTAINSYQQLEQMVENFTEFGIAATDLEVFLPNVIVPAIVGSGLNQFAPTRNNEIAMSWEIGEFGTPRVKYMKSNLLPAHISGDVGVQGQTLTVVSTNDPTGAAISQITCSGATNNKVGALVNGDLGQFQDGVGSLTNLRFLTFIGGSQTSQPVQIRVTNTSVTADGSGNVIFNIYPTLQITPNPTNDNIAINANILAGMQLKFLPSHRAGFIVANKAFFMSMPRLPDQDPFTTASETDMDTGASLRMTVGSLFGQNFKGTIHDETHGSILEPDYSMRLIFPL